MMMMTMNDDDNDEKMTMMATATTKSLSSKQGITMSHVRRSYMTMTVRGTIKSYVQSLKLKSFHYLHVPSSASMAS